MYNYCQLIGTLKEVKEITSTKVIITLGVQREFKNADGTFDCDYIPVECTDFLCDFVKENYSIGDCVAVKCRLSKVTEHDTLRIIAVRFILMKGGE